MKNSLKEISRSLFAMVHGLLPVAVDNKILILNTAKKEYIKQFKYPQDKINIVFFWKQNDSGIYGRRQDMLVKYLMKSGRVNKILHFDAPIDTKTIYTNAKNGITSNSHQGARIAQNCTERFLKLQDDNNIYRRTFVYGNKPFMGINIPKKKDSYPEFVESCIKETGISDNTIAWVCPIVWDFPKVQKHLGFSYIIADIIDDQLTFSQNKEYNKQVNSHYKSIINYSSLCLVNCKNMQLMVKQFGKEAVLIPNGAEIFKNSVNLEVPAELKNIKKPIVGYVGNLSLRINYKLIEKIAQTRPDFSIVLIGSIHNNNKSKEILEKYSNIHFMGVIPYERVRSYISCFDIAIIPHQDNLMTRKMDPLKLYLFLSLGVPIVTTDILDVDGLYYKDVLIAKNDDDFIKKIDFVLNNKKLGITNKIDSDLLNTISWENRIESIFKAFDERVMNRNYGT